MNWHLFDHYAFLGVPHDATVLQIEAGYHRQCARRVSRWGCWRARCPAEIEAAFMVLCLPEARRAYDDWLASISLEMACQPLF